jgi:hypothetical protein
MSIRHISLLILATIFTLSAALAAPGERQAGDTIADAVAIPALPFTGSGTTVGYTNDFDEVCPFTGSLAPDVVYSFTPATGVVAEIDLCGSSYDTKLYVYDADLQLLACNDDYVSPYCTVLRSRLDGVLMDAGVTYYLVIDGYGTQAGDYVLHVDAADGCALELPGGAALEGEPPLTANYADLTNGGCSSPDPSHPVQTLTGDADGALVLCGRSGWYATVGGMASDQDYFAVEIGASGIISGTIDAELRHDLHAAAPFECDQPGPPLAHAASGPCAPGDFEIEGAPGAVVWLLIYPMNGINPGFFDVYPYDYVLQLSGLATTVASEPSSWGRVKSLYR